MKRKTDEELKRIAIDLYDGKIFSDRHFRSPEEAQSFFGLVFMVFSLTNMKLKNIAFVYEYFSAAGPRGINGYPIFTSCRYLNKSDTKKMFGFFEEYKKLKDGFMSEKK
jgi:hypothetical protein